MLKHRNVPQHLCMFASTLLIYEHQHTHKIINSTANYRKYCTVND